MNLDDLINTKPTDIKWARWHGKFTPIVT